MLMKKIFTFVMCAMAAMSAGAQEFNLFDAADCDADGWLWLNTEAKIAKYVGMIDEDNYTVNPNGKPIQMAFANIMPDYPETYADPEVYGVDTEGYTIMDADVKKDEIIQGAIVLAPASAQMSTNGGCLVLNLPACASINLMLSSEARMLGRTLMLTPGKDMSVDDSSDQNWTGSTKAIYSQASLFKALHSAGQYKWEGIESLNNGFDRSVTFKSESPVYFAFQNCHKYPIYVHAIKVTTPKQESAGISDLSANSGTNGPVYNLAGQRVKHASKSILIQDGKKFVSK